jgi:predicted acetyltransferase
LPTSEPVSLQRATPDMAPMLSNLLELYVHDLSEIFPVELGPDGRFGYETLPLYWADPATHYAFLIKRGSHVAGFAFATRGSPASDDPEDLDVAEFFVLRGYRRSGVGRQAAMALWDSVPGHWVVRVSEANRPGLPFWSEVIRSYTCGDFVERVRPGNPQSWRVFRFASTAWRTASNGRPTGVAPDGRR